MTLNLGIVAATLTGNRGAEAMLLAVVQYVSQKNPNTVFHILSYSPEADLRWLRGHERLKGQRVYIHSSTPVRLLLNWLPWGLLLNFFPALKRKLEFQDRQGFRCLSQLDAVVDLAGVSFMDDRLKYLPFNILTIWPWLLVGVPVCKLAQAMGPFDNKLNQLAARKILGSVSLLVSRGFQTTTFLEKLNLKRPFLQSSDTAFQLSFTGAHMNFNERSEKVLVVPSSLMLGKNPAYLEDIVTMVRKLRAQSIQVDLLAHSWKKDTDRARNNDWPLCREIHRRLGNPKDIKLWGFGLDAVECKEKISEYRLVVTSRFHAMIAALDSETPVLVLGWSHKYREVLMEFDLEGLAVTDQIKDDQFLYEVVRKALQDAEDLHRKISKVLPCVRQKSLIQFEALSSILTQGQARTYAD